MIEHQIKLLGVDQTVAEVRALAEGAAAPAVLWAQHVLAGRVVNAWQLMADDLRLATAQAWIHRNGHHPAIDAYGRDRLARALAQPVAAAVHTLWPAFGLAVLSEILLDLPGWRADQLGFYSRHRPVAPDHAVVLLGQGDMYRVVDYSQRRVMYPLLMRHTAAGWLIARAGADTAAVPGWPPQFPAGRDFYRLDRQ